MAVILSVPALPANAPGDSALVEAWNRFAREANEFQHKYKEGQIDLRLMKRLSADWRDIEHSGSWPLVK